MSKKSSINTITERNVEVIAAMEETLERHRTRGERVADRFAAVVGSWTFIIIQSALLIAWITFNVIAWENRWDPYPFILLNLALSFQAAYASPIIMMSQNRQSLTALRRNELDLQINLLAEQESTQVLRLVKRLCEKAGIDPHDDPELEALSKATRPAELAREIDHAIIEKVRNARKPAS